LPTQNHLGPAFISHGHAGRKEALCQVLSIKVCENDQSNLLIYLVDGHNTILEKAGNILRFVLSIIIIIVITDSN